MKEKRGAVNWTVGKLINTVLLIVVMALVIYGVTTGGLNPLFENVEARFDEVLIMFNIKDDVSFEKCYSAEVLSLGGGEVFLKNVGLGGNGVVLNVCRDRMCNFTGELSEYRNAEGVFERFDGEDWRAGSLIFAGDMNEIKKNWEIYQGALEVIRNSDIGAEILDGVNDTKKFVLYGDGYGPGDPITAIWQNNEWIIERGEWVESYDDDDFVFDFFYIAVTSFFNDDVYWTVLDVDEELDVDNMRPIYEIIGGDDIYFRGELRRDEDVEKLKKEFFKKRALFLKELDVPFGDVEKLKKDIDGRSFLIGDDVFKLNVVDIPSSFVVGSGDVWLYYYPHGKTRSDFFYVSLDDSPFVLASFDKNWEKAGNEEYYKLFDKKFKEVWSLTLVDDFLRAKCR